MPHTSTTPPALQDGDLLAAIDLGSNSFHMVIARYTLGQLRVIDRLLARRWHGRRAGWQRRTVFRRTAARAGMPGPFRPAHPQCAAASGARVATNTVRQLRSPQSFLVPAETALGHAIEVVSGREEARLIYWAWPTRNPPSPASAGWVIDIGGGSTEFIIGMGMQTLERESLQAVASPAPGASSRRQAHARSAGRTRWPRSAASSSTSPASTARWAGRRRWVLRARTRRSARSARR